MQQLLKKLSFIIIILNIIRSSQFFKGNKDNFEEKNKQEKKFLDVNSLYYLDEHEDGLSEKIHMMRKLSEISLYNNSSIAQNLEVNTFNFSNSGSIMSNLNKLQNENLDLNLWSDFYNSPEILLYLYNETFPSKIIQIKNKKNLFLTEKNIVDISPPVSITKNPSYLKFQITMIQDFLDKSDCKAYQLIDFSYVTIKNCTFTAFDSQNNFLVAFNLIILSMKIDKVNINQCLVEKSNYYQNSSALVAKLTNNKLEMLISPQYLTKQITFTECKQAFCKELDSTNSGALEESFYEPVFDQYNFKIDFLNLEDYELELFKAFLIVRNKDYDMETRLQINSTYEIANSNFSKLTEIDSSINDFESDNNIAFFTDITKIVSIKGNKYQINLEVFPQFFDLYLIFDVQRLNYNLTNTVIVAQNGSIVSSNHENVMTINDNIYSMKFQVNFIFFYFKILI